MRNPCRLCSSYTGNTEKMLFNGTKIALSRKNNDELEAVTSGWFFNGERLHDLGPSNVSIQLSGDKINTEVSEMLPFEKGKEAMRSVLKAQIEAMKK